jgi:hypothetical protein
MGPDISSARPHNPVFMSFSEPLKIYIFVSIANSSTLKMKVVGYSETSINLNQNERHHIPEDKRPS